MSEVEELHFAGPMIEVEPAFARSTVKAAAL
jgi:hypothetical protein